MADQQPNGFNPFLQPTAPAPQTTSPVTPPPPTPIVPPTPTAFQNPIPVKATPAPTKKPLSKPIKFHLQLSYWHNKAFDNVEFEVTSLEEFRDAVRLVHECGNDLKVVVDASPFPNPPTREFSKPASSNSYTPPPQQPVSAPIASAIGGQQIAPGLTVNPNPIPPQVPQYQQAPPAVSQYVPGSSGIYATPNFQHPLRSQPNQQQMADLARLNALGANGAVPVNWKRVLGIPVTPWNGGGGFMQQGQY